MSMEAQVAENSEAIRELQKTVIILQRDQQNLEKYVTEMKDEFKGELQQTESRLQQAFSTLRNDVVDAFKSAKEAFPMKASVIIAALGVVVAVIGIFHTGR